jgi:tetratricopeptide (TPR) repeat protein
LERDRGLERWPAYYARERALADLERAIAQTPDALDARFYYASFLRDHGRFDDAIAAFETVLAVMPDKVETLVALGVVLARRGRRLDARAVFERAVAHDGAHAGALVNLANLLALDEPARAETLYHAALHRDVRLAPAHRGLCSLAAAAGDMAAAARHREAGYADGPFARSPYYGERMPVTILALVSTDGGNIPLEALLDPRVFLAQHLFVEVYRDEPLPPHVAIVNAIADADRAAAALQRAAVLCARASVPVINAPADVARSGRVANAARFAGIEDAVVPSAAYVRRDAPVPAAFPVIVRVPGRHMGRAMQRADDAAAYAAALRSLPGGDELIAIAYVETRSGDGAWRKYRVMCIDSVLYPLHLAIAQRWDVHYFSASMREYAAYRAEEARFLTDPRAAIGARAWTALTQVCAVLDLQYAGIDFGLTDDGRAVIFEANAAMTVLPPDPDPVFAYRVAASATIAAAIETLILSRLRA